MKEFSGIMMLSKTCHKKTKKMLSTTINCGDDTRMRQNGGMFLDEIIFCEKSLWYKVNVFMKGEILKIVFKIQNKFKSSNTTEFKKLYTRSMAKSMKTSLPLHTQ